MDAATIDLTVLVERLRLAGFRVDTRQYLAAHELLLAYAERGRALDADVAALSSHLGPIFCTQPEEQQRFAIEVAAWRGTGRQDVPPASAQDRQTPFESWRHWRGRFAAASIGAALLASVGGLLHYEYSEVTLSGVVLVATGQGNAIPAPGARVRFRDSPVVLDAQAKFHVTTTRAAGFGSLQADLEGYLPVSQSVSAATDQPIGMVLQLPVVPPVAPPQQNFTLGTPQAISLGAPAPEARAGGAQWSRIATGAALTVLIALALLGGAAATRRRLALQRLQAAGEADEVTLTPPAASAIAASDFALRRLASAWRRPREQAIVELDTAATIDATLRSGGLFAPVYVPRRAAPEYLALVHRCSADDHWAGFVTEWLNQLAATGVVVEVFTFHDDPRICYANDEKRRGHRLVSLVAQHHRSTVLLFAEARVCFAAAQDAPEAWVAILQALPRRVLFTPEAPYRWARREWALAAEGFAVLPANAEGFRLFGAIAGDWRMERMFPAAYARAFPRMLADEPQRWLDGNAPARDSMEELVRELRGYLGPDGFAWLCGCAVYPQVSWPLTLFLAGTLDGNRGDGGGAPALLEILPALGRLPWLRHGFMPDWLRRALIARLTPEQDATVRRGVEVLLEQLALASAPAAVTAGVAPLAPRAGNLSISRWIGPVDLLGAAPAGSPLSERVFLGFMSNSNVDPLSVGVADSLRKLFGRDAAAFADTATRGRSATNTAAPAATTAPQAQVRIFLSYRRSDSAPYAGRLTDDLRRGMPHAEVFSDVAIAAGTLWTKALDEGIRRADVVLVMIGPSWGTRYAADKSGRVSGEQDPVHREVVAALAQGKRVIPLLVGGATMPARSDLPDDLAALVGLNALELADDHWADAVARLISILPAAQASSDQAATDAPREPPRGSTVALRPPQSLRIRTREAANEGTQWTRAAFARLRAWMAFHPYAAAGIASMATGLLAMAILWALLPRALVQVSPPTGRSFAAFSADGRWLVTRDASGEAVLVVPGASNATATGSPPSTGAGAGVANVNPIRTIPLRTSGARATAAAFGADGSVVHVGYQDGTLRTFAVPAGKEVASVAAQGPGAVLALAVGADGTPIALTPTALVIMTAASRRIDLAARLNAARSKITAASFDRDGTRAALHFANGDVQVVIMNGATGFEQAFSTSCDAGSALALSPDGSRVACADATREVDIARVTLRDAVPVPPLRLAGGPDASSAVTALAFSPDLRWLAGAHNTGEVDFWEVGSGRLVASSRAAGTSPARAAAFNAAGDIFAAAGLTDLEFWPLALRARDGKSSAGPEPAAGNAVDVVPSLLRMTTNAARSALDRHQLVLGTVQTRASSAGKGTIVAQDPPAGRRVAATSAVNVVIADGSLVRVPNLIGLPLDAAQKTLASVGLALASTPEAVAASRSGTVAAQQPAAGVEVAPSSSVALTLARASANPPTQKSDSAPPTNAANPASGVPAGATPALNAPGNLRIDAPATGSDRPPTQNASGWCCVRPNPAVQSGNASIRNPVFAAQAGECAKAGGRYVASRAEAETLCGIPLPTKK